MGSYKLKEIAMEIQILKDKMISILKEMDNQNWHTAIVTFQFPPVISKGYKTLPVFVDKENSMPRIPFPSSQEFYDVLFRYIVHANKTDNVNELRLEVDHNSLDDAKLSTSFNPEIVKNFENNLPKSLRGKTTPWWKNPEETKGLD
jgi:hypothetical protein